MNNNLNKNEVAFYTISFLNKNEQGHIDQLLPFKKWRRNRIKHIITKVIKSKYGDIKNVRLRFRKKVSGFQPNEQGTTSYLDFVKEKKGVDRMKRIFNNVYVKKHPYVPQSVTVNFSRHLYINIDDLHSNLRILYQEQKLQ